MTTSAQSVPLPEPAKAWLDGRVFVTVATIEPDGRPHLSVLWVARDGDDILLSTVRGRRKERNLSRDPRITVCAFPEDNPYSYLEVRGVATMTDEGGDDLINALSAKYRGVTPYPGIGPDEPRVVIRVRAEKVVFRG